MEQVERGQYKKTAAALPTVFGIAWNMAYHEMKALQLRGSMTVEAAFVMAIVLWAMLFSMQTAYRLRDETVGAMALQFAAEQLRSDEQRDESYAAQIGSTAAGHPFSWKDYNMELKISGNGLIGSQVSANSSGGNWTMSLTQKVFDPENFMRKLTLLEPE